jgi:hypothetical protein
MISDIKLIKKRKELYCLSFRQNDELLFAKIYYLENNQKLKEDYDREVSINKYLKNKLKNKNYYSNLLEIRENVEPDECFLKYISQDRDDPCNILIYEHAGNHTLRYYINRISQKTFNDLLNQLREATKLLQEVHVIHYDLYCESNILVKKEKKKFIIKIVDFGLSYIDDSDDTDSDYLTAIESIRHYNKKHHIA